MITDYGPQGNLDGLHNNNKFQPSLSNFNNQNLNFNFNYPTTNLYGLPAIHGINDGTVNSPYFYGNIMENNNLQNLQQSASAFYNFQPNLVNVRNKFLKIFHLIFFLIFAFNIYRLLLSKIQKFQFAPLTMMK